MKKQDLWWTCGQSGTLHLVPARQINEFFEYHLKECSQCTCIRNGSNTLQDFYPNTALVGYSYKFVKPRSYWVDPFLDNLATGRIRYI